MAQPIRLSVFQVKPKHGQLLRKCHVIISLVSSTLWKVLGLRRQCKSQNIIQEGRVQMENRCPQCEEMMYQDSEYKGVIIYMCPNLHRTGFMDEQGRNVPIFKTEVNDDESGSRERISWLQ
jgi:hypothetical protein